MAKFKATDLKPGPYREILIEADRRGASETGVHGLDAPSVFIAGLCAIIADLREEIKALKETQKNGQP